MLPLDQDPSFTFRFGDAPIIPRIRLDGVEARARVGVQDRAWQRRAAGRVAAAGVGLFAVSKFDPGYRFVKEAEFRAALAALREAGNSVEAVVP